jgi:hypothetical protein
MSRRFLAQLNVRYKRSIEEGVMVDEAEEDGNLGREVDVFVDAAVMDLVTEVDAAIAKHDIQVPLSEKQKVKRSLQG